MITDICGKSWASLRIIYIDVLFLHLKMAKIKQETRKDTWNRYPGISIRKIITF